MKPGTLVLLKRISNPEAPSMGLRVGHIGEVKPSNLVTTIKLGRVLVEFPGTTPRIGYWQCLPHDLIPLSGPDIDVSSSDEEHVVKTPTEENV